MLAKITKSTVEKLPLNSILWDTQLVGFGVRRQRRHPFYVLRYRFSGRQRLVSIGRHGSWTTDTARNEARRLLGLVAGRVDPAAQREAQQQSDRETFAATLTGYLERKRSTLRPRSFQGIEHHLTVHCKPLHHLRLTDIDRRTVALRLAEVERRRGPRARNKVRASLSAFFTWAVREGLTETNPVAATGKAQENPGRDRVLSQTELTTILHALNDLGEFGDIIRLLVLTGQRRTEIGGLRWSEIDLDRNLICLPPERTKNNRLHELPISRQVRAILKRQPRRQGRDLIFGSGPNGFYSWSIAKDKLDHQAKLKLPWCIHDLRR